MTLTSGQNNPGYYIDEEHKKRQVTEIEFLKGDEQYTNKVDMAFDALFEGAQSDPEYLENQRQLVLENEDICANGDRHGVSISCAKKTGKMKETLSYFTPARKHKQIKLLTLWLQDDKNNFGRYSYYGCYCLPEGFENIAAKGYGQPVDDIDKSCKARNQCYDCVRLGNDAVGGSQMTCDPDSVLYSFKLAKENDQNVIHCLDEINTCEYRTCSCDKAQAESHQKNQDKFSHKFDTKWGVETGGPSAEPKWKYNQQCVKMGGNKYGKPTECCGTSFPNMIPKQQGKQCCGYRPFDPTTRQCCSGNKIRPEC